MTRLYLERMDVDCVDFGAESTLPMLYEVDAKEDFMASDLPEGDGLSLRYAFLKSAFPYRAQDNYTRDFTGEKLEGVVLENDYLKATFAPTVGGKLWSLFDKAAGKELLFNNTVARPAYFAARNAWCSGGVEFNCGIFGHSPLTCSTLFAGTLTGPGGEPMLRIYEYERVRGVVYQMDFMLPSDSKVLICRMRVVNPSFKSTAMYWWSNIAVPHVDGARVIVPADNAYTPVDNVMSVVPTPVRNGVNVTYPYTNPVSVDYFFRTDKNRRMYTCQLSKEGYGLFQCSTDRLQGRKIFVWGKGPGGRKWQEYLSGVNAAGEYNDGRYCEIQCGLAHTQSEHLYMPPKTAWEWVEIYGAMHADPEKIHHRTAEESVDPACAKAKWDEARAEVEARIDEFFTREAMDALLESTREYAMKPAEKMLFTGSGWGALENLRREKSGLGKMCPHLDFGEIGEAQKPWAELLETGSMGRHDSAAAPGSWMRQEEWTRMLESAVEGEDRENWYTLLQLGVYYLALPDLPRAEAYINRSLAARWTAWGVYALAEARRLHGEDHRAAIMMVEAALFAPEDASLAKMAARNLNRTGDYITQIQFTSALPEALQQLPRIRLYRANALVNTGDADGAEALLFKDGKWLEVPDMQEGEISLSELWYLIQEARAAREGREFDRSKVSPPYELDFRMFAAE